MCLSGILLGLTCQKILSKVQGFKKIKNEDGHIEEQFSIEGVFKSSGHYDYVSFLK